MESCCKFHDKICFRSPEVKNAAHRFSLNTFIGNSSPHTLCVFGCRRICYRQITDFKPGVVRIQQIPAARSCRFPDSDRDPGRGNRNVFNIIKVGKRRTRFVSFRIYCKFRLVYISGRFTCAGDLYPESINSDIGFYPFTITCSEATLPSTGLGNTSITWLFSPKRVKAKQKTIEKMIFFMMSLHKIIFQVGRYPFHCSNTLNP